MLKLYDFPSSNSVNIFNLALLEKVDALFEYVLTSQSPDLLARSPRGKVPFQAASGRSRS